MIKLVKQADIVKGSLARITAGEGLIVNGDAIEVMRQIPDESIDVIITSPPYNLLNSTGNGLKKNTRCGKWINAAIKEGYEDYDDNLPYDQYISWQRKCLAEMVRLIKPTGAIFYNNKNRVQGGLLQNREEIVRGFPLRQIITWQRSGSINFNAGYFLPTTEQIYLVCKPKFKLKRGANRLTDVWKIKQEMKNPHPAPFPVQLVDNILDSCDGEIVLDPFSGSGTTGLSALNHRKKFILIEKSIRYCEMTKKRLEENGDWRTS